MFVNIIPLTKLPLSKPQVYTYQADDLASKIKIGQLVEVPLYNRNALGIVKEILTAKPVVSFKFKTINKIIDEHPILNSQDLTLADFISQYYFSSLGLILKHLTPEIPKRKVKKLVSELAKINLNIINNNQTNNSNLSTKLIINSKIERQQEYLKIIQINLQQKKQTLMLVPEISLIPQTLNWLKQNFSNEKIILLNSGESKTNTLINWRRAQTGDAKIFLGTRKAIFTSFHDLGAIIIDEEQDLSHKQWDMNPRYDARTVAKQKAKLYNCKLILGASTPSVNTYFKFENKNNFSVNKNKTKIIDMRNEMRKGNFTIFSDELQNQIIKNLENKKQIILFVNRKGSSTFVMCRDCGQVVRCPKCQIALMEHANKTLSCNHCNFKSPSPLICPKCSSHKIKSFGLGVEKLELEIKNNFPQAKVARLDTGVTARFKDLEQRINDFEQGQIDILVGTQIVLNITSPNLNLIAGVAIDSVLNFPDWTTDERAWHLLNKITNRPEQSIIQTYNSENKLLQYIDQNKFEEFYQQELINRQMLKYPPFSKIIKLICKSDDYDLVQSESNRIAVELRKVLPV